MEIPDNCLICDEYIGQGDSVLFHCECLIAVCKNCASRQVAAQPTTYCKGLLCPVCRVSSDNIRGIEECKEAESELISSALRCFNIRSGRADEGVKKCLLAMYNAGYRGTLDIRGQISFDGIDNRALRLELARIENKRTLHSIRSSSSLNVALLEDDEELPMGPLLYLRFTKNAFLERALKILRDRTIDRSSGINGAKSSIAIVEHCPKRNLHQARQRPMPGKTEFFEAGSRVRILTGDIHDRKCGTISGHSIDGDTVIIEYYEKSQIHCFKTSRSNLKLLNTRKKKISEDTVENGDHKKIKKGDSSKVEVEISDGNNMKAEDLAAICICKTYSREATIKCQNGTGGCNGYVHMACIPALSDISQIDRKKFEADFVCPLCVSVLFPGSVQNLKQESNKVLVTQGKYKGKKGKILKEISSGIFQVALVDPVEGSDKTVTLRSNKFIHFESENKNPEERKNSSSSDNCSNETSSVEIETDIQSTESHDSTLEEESKEHLHVNQSVLRTITTVVDPKPNQALLCWVDKVMKTFPVLISEPIHERASLITLDHIIAETAVLVIPPAGPIKELHSRLLSLSAYSKILIDTFKRLVEQSLDAFSWVDKDDMDVSAKIEQNMLNGCQSLKSKYKSIGLRSASLENVMNVLTWCISAKFQYLNKSRSNRTHLDTLLELANSLLKDSVSVTFNEAKYIDVGKFSKLIFNTMDFWRRKVFQSADHSDSNTVEVQTSSHNENFSSRGTVCLNRKHSNQLIEPGRALSQNAFVLSIPFSSTNGDRKDDNSCLMRREEELIHDGI